MGKVRRGGAEVTSLGRLASSLVQVSTGVPLIPSCIDAEQFSVRDCPAVSKPLKGSMLTVGGEGAAEGRLAHMTTCNTIVFLNGLLHVQHSQLTMTEAVPSPISLAITKLGTPAGGLAVAWQVKVVLSAVLSGFKVRVLVNDGLEPEIVTLLDKGVLPLSQVISMPVIATSVSVAESMEMVQVRMRGAIRPANSGPGGTVMTTSGVETGRKDNVNIESIVSHVE